MKVAIYARVSTDDKGQDPETQLMPLREYCRGEFQLYKEYVDHASAIDYRRRTAWRELLEDASKHKFDLVLVWKMDRAFRSTIDAGKHLEMLRAWKIAIRSYQEPFADTSTPIGEAMYFLISMFADMERKAIRERVMAGLDRVRRQGKKLGRPGKELSKRKESRILVLHEQGHTIRQIAELVNANRTAVFKAIKKGSTQ